MLDESRVRVWAAWALGLGFALAALAALATFAAFEDIESARESIRRGQPASPENAGALIDVATLFASGSAIFALLGAFGTLAWRVARGRSLDPREINYALPALVVGAVLLYPILREYTGAIMPSDPLAKAPVLLAMGVGIAVLVWRTRAALLAGALGTLALVAGAVHAKAYGPWWSLPDGSMHPIALEDLWAAAGFALLAVALAIHARSLQRATSLSARSTVATDMPV